MNISLLFLLLISSGFAQSARENFTKKFQNLEYRLNYIERQAKKYGANNALQLVLKARNELNNSKNAFWQMKFSKARQYYKKALFYTDQAAKRLLFKPLARAKKDFYRLIRRAEALLQSSDNTNARYMLTRARAFQLKAARAYQNFQLVKGQEYQRIATYFANRALDLAGQNNKNREAKSQFIEQLKNLKKLYRTVTTSKISNSEITRLIKKVSSYFQASQKYFNQGDMKQALIRLQIGERLLYRALDLQQASGEGRKEQLRSNLFSLKDYINGIEKDIPGTSALPLLRKAKQFMRAARRDYEKSHYPDAQSKIALAQRMATKALYSASLAEAGGADLLKERADEIRHIIALQNEKYTTKNKEMAFLHNQAEKLLQLAQNAASVGKYRLAFGELRLAFKIVHQVERMQTASRAAVKIDQQKLQNDLTRLGNDLRMLSLKTTLPMELKPALALLNNLLQRADQNFKQGRFTIARQLTNLLQQQFSALLKQALKK